MTAMEVAVLDEAIAHCHQWSEAARWRPHCSATCQREAERWVIFVATLRGRVAAPWAA
jgi:hypothetical protein